MDLTSLFNFARRNSLSGALFLAAWGLASLLSEKFLPQDFCQSASGYGLTVGIAMLAAQGLSKTYSAFRRRRGEQREVNIKIRFKRFARSNGEFISINTINALTRLVRGGGSIEYEAKALCWAVRSAYGNAVAHLSVAEIKSLSKSGLIVVSGFRAMPTDKTYFLAGAKREDVLLTDNHRVSQKQNHKNREKN